MGFSRQKYWSRLSFPPPGDLPHPGMQPWSPALAGEFFTTTPPGKPDNGILLLLLLLSRFSRVRLCDAMDCSPPGSSVHGDSPARILQWVAISSSRGSSPPRDPTRVSWVSYIAGRSFTTWAITQSQTPSFTPEAINTLIYLVVASRHPPLSPNPGAQEQTTQKPPQATSLWEAG